MFMKDSWLHGIIGVASVTWEFYDSIKKGFYIISYKKKLNLFLNLYFGFLLCLEELIVCSEYYLQFITTPMWKMLLNHFMKSYLKSIVYYSSNCYWWRLLMSYIGCDITLFSYVYICDLVVGYLFICLATPKHVIIDE